MISSLWDVLGVPSTRVSINAKTFVSYILPPLVCYFTLAILVIRPRTRSARVALWPIFASLALRATASVDMSNGKPELGVVNAYLACAMFNLTARALIWTLAREPLVRHFRPGKSSPSIIVDALDLTINFRGYGWNWSSGLPFPQDTRPKNRFAFALHTFLSVVANLFVFGIFQRAALSFRPSDCTTMGFSLFDDTLPFFVRHLRAIVIALIQYTAGYCSLRAGYDLFATVGVLVFGQDPAQWPPAFDAPWRATSLGEFWGRRWHQWFRHIFLVLGGYPCQSWFGRAGIVLGGFLASAVLHAVLAIGGGIREDAWILSFGLIVMAFLVLAERAFYRLTGNKVGGWGGWIWTVGWLLVTSSWSFDAWAKSGGMGNSSLIDGVRPVRMLVERLAKGLDNCLRAL